jgi:peptidoglycan hydrolase-like protein with peptidoglycan-binding domain
MAVKRTRRAAAIGGAAAVTGIAVVAAVGFGGGEPATPAASDLPPGTAQVTTQTLTQTEKVTGTLGYGAPKALAAKASGTVTWLPPLGSTVVLGKPAYKVDGEPVVLIRGSVPPYRTLQPGVEGPDVKQFEQSLRKLGYAGFTVDAQYTASTADAVREWQEDLGVAETGTVGADRIAVAPGDIRVASHGVEVGGAAVGGPVLTYSGTVRVVTVALDVAKQHLVKKGVTATVTLPDGSDVAGTVSGVGTVATPGADGANPTIEVVVGVTDQRALGTLDAAPVSVALVAATRESVLTVPVAALVALAEGGYGVQVVEGAASGYVAVETGMFGNGRVEISGAGIAEGTTVGVPSP